MVRAAVQTPGRRQRSENKRAAVLAAAQALFVSKGYELTSVDAIADRAGVSKRTVYDHFGDKQTVFQTVLARVNEALLATVCAAIDEEITDGRDLRDALAAFATRVATEAFPSPDYVAFQRLTSQGRSAPRLSEAARDRPERMLEDRFAKLVADGKIRAADHRVAAKHFTALTIFLALEAIRDDPATMPREPEISAIITDGVDAFLRAYS